MRSIGLLMREHRLIEQAIPVMKKETERLEKTHELNNEWISSIADFFKTYADKLHHGKEENILFNELKKKTISKEHETIMNNLIKDHEKARLTIKSLIKTKDYKEAIKLLNTLIDLYPKHIETEDKQFFFPIIKYFNSKEQDELYNTSIEFDKQFIHKKYQELLNQLK